jgi:hypothetical protein
LPSLMKTAFDGAPFTVADWIVHILPLRLPAQSTEIRPHPRRPGSRPCGELNAQIVRNRDAQTRAAVRPPGVSQQAREHHRHAGPGTQRLRRAGGAAAGGGRSMRSNSFDPTFSRYAPGSWKSYPLTIVEGTQFSTAIDGVVSPAPDMSGYRCTVYVRFLEWHQEADASDASGGKDGSDCRGDRANTAPVPDRAWAIEPVAPTGQASGSR